MADDLRPCPFCGNPTVQVHYGKPDVTFLLCGDDYGRGGCGAVVSFRPNLTGRAAMDAYNRRAAAVEATHA